MRFFVFAATLAASCLPVQAWSQVQPQTAVSRLISSTKFRAAAGHLRADHERLVAEIIRITEIPAPPFGEGPRALAYADMMRASGLRDVSVDAIGNVIGVRPGADRALPPLIVAAHLDTVFPKETDVTVRRQGTRLMAPGIGDDSRGTAVLLAFIRALDSAGIVTDRDILFIGNVGEEGPGDLRGMRHLFGNDPRAKRAAAFITVDSSGAEQIVTRGVGSRRYHVVFEGPGGHSFDKFGIVNPAAALARAVTGLYAIPVPSDPKTTYSASILAGGTSVNTIPASVSVDIDIRSVAAAEVARVDAAFKAVAQRAVDEENAARSTERGTVRVRFEQIGDRPAGRTDENDALARTAHAASAAFGYAPRFIAVSTDANVAMSLGIPAIAIGSGGSGGYEHSPDEYIDVEIGESVRGMSVGLATILGVAGSR
ncbi:M20/M25/M40 family metallo-hydrolase [Sphingomonas sp.]|uniref:M20/M25/M40 family metallo-hydrolase n=1 Tax=Sphingomonas sp. TaxID=28214 RepID=UPI002DD6B6F2|nr:M20/M25/M40 family metallo-hydrolase [Sphingomonas sp.]